MKRLVFMNYDDYGCGFSLDGLIVEYNMPYLTVEERHRVLDKLIMRKSGRDACTVGIVQLINEGASQKPANRQYVYK